jgi:hypothetical protein
VAGIFRTGKGRRYNGNEPITTYVDVIPKFPPGSGTPGDPDGLKRKFEELEKASRDPLQIEKQTYWNKPRLLDLAVDRVTNTITIERAERIIGLRILANDELLNLDQEVKVLFRGKTLFRGPQQRSAAFLLKEARTTHRRDVTYWSAIDVKF